MTDVLQRDAETGQFRPTDERTIAEQYVEENGNFFQRLLF